MAENRKIIELRELLAAKFPATAAAPSRDVFSTGLPQFDQAHGGFPTATIVEIFGTLATGSLFCAALLHNAAQQRKLVGLIDAGGEFDPGAEGNIFSRMLWVCCRDVGEAIKATDLLLRDGNLPLLILDLQPAADARPLRRIPASTWHRFLRLLEEKRTTTLVALTYRPMIEAAAMRLHITSPPFALPSMRIRQTDLMKGLTTTILKQRFYVGGAPEPVGAQMA